MFGLLYQECLQTGPLVFIWIFHFILPRVIRLFRVYSDWWIISFTPLRSLKPRRTARACPKGSECVCVLQIMAPWVHDRCPISLHDRQHLYKKEHVWPLKETQSARSPVFSLHNTVWRVCNAPSSADGFYSFTLMLACWMCCLTTKSYESLVNLCVLDFSVVIRSCKAFLWFTLIATGYFNNFANCSCWWARFLFPGGRGGQNTIKKSIYLGVWIHKDSRYDSLQIFCRLAGLVTG